MLIQSLSAAASLSYAVPGTVLAIGLLIPLARLDNAIDAAMRAEFGLSTGLVFSGTAFALVLAYAIRFLAASLGAIEAGLAKISHNIDAAARTLGASVSEMSWSVHLPLLRPALGAVAASLAPVLLLHGIIVAGRPGGLQGSPAMAISAPDSAPASLLIS
jgi:iron(III) transport system permease protein